MELSEQRGLQSTQLFNLGDRAWVFGGLVRGTEGALFGGQVEDDSRLMRVRVRAEAFSRLVGGC